VLLTQVKELLLPDMVHMTSPSYCVAWSQAIFTKAHAALLPKNRSTLPNDAKWLIADMEDAKGTVGAEAVYGTKVLSDALQKKLQAAGEGTGGTGLLDVDRKRGRMQTLDSFIHKDIRQDSRLLNNQGDEDAQAAQGALQKAPGGAEADAAKKSPERMRSRVSIKTSLQPSDQELAKTLVVKRGSLRTMALMPHAKYHLALAQMAAVLRVAKESENSLRKNENSRESEVQELRQECDAWRAESDRLSLQVKDLEQVVQETGGSRPPTSM
jgi:hypothetical protein